MQGAQHRARGKSSSSMIVGHLIFFPVVYLLPERHWIFEQWWILFDRRVANAIYPLWFRLCSAHVWRDLRRGSKCPVLSILSAIGTAAAFGFGVRALCQRFCVLDFQAQVIDTALKPRCPKYFSRRWLPLDDRTNGHHHGCHILLRLCIDHRQVAYDLRLCRR